jgi:hypothetical protein
VYASGVIGATHVANVRIASAEIIGVSIRVTHATDAQNVASAGIVRIVRSRIGGMSRGVVTVTHARIRANVIMRRIQAVKMRTSACMSTVQMCCGIVVSRGARASNCI